MSYSSPGGIGTVRQDEIQPARFDVRDARGELLWQVISIEAGGEDRHQPAFLLRRPETTELAAEISNSAPTQNKPGSSRAPLLWTGETIRVSIMQPRGASRAWEPRARWS